jgi:hypothetical protein
MGIVDIDEGAIELSEADGARLSGRRYRVVNAPPQLLVGFEAQDGLPDERLILAGDLARIAFSEIVSLVAQARISGVLRVMGTSVTRTVAFADGEVRGATSARAGERLGDVMVRLGQLTRAQLEGLLVEAGDARSAGRLAVERGLLTERGLWQAVQEHVTAVFQAILLEADGSFLLTDERVRDALTLPGLSAEGLLMEGARRIDEMRVSADPGGRSSIDSVLSAYDSAFRDIFATASEAGAGDALHSAALSILDDDPLHAEVFGDLRFGPAGGLPAGELAKHVDSLARETNRSADLLLGDSLSTLTLFLLFVAGEQLAPDVHRALHARVKAIVARPGPTS